MSDFIADDSDQILFPSRQHLSLVVQCVVPAAVIAVAALAHRNPSLASPANGVPAAGPAVMSSP